MRTYAWVAALLAALFVAFSLAVAAHFFTLSDLDVAAAFRSLWVPDLELPFRGIALLGGLEATTLLGLLLFVVLWRRGYHLGAFASSSVPLLTITEFIYKHTINHPGPPAALSHPDGPSLSHLFESAGGGWSFPSGHMSRTVLVYGLTAFVVQRLATRGRVRRVAVALALLAILLMVFDRLYLEVHWVSDVIGGLLLGATFLAASITWLEWSEARTAE